MIENISTQIDHYAADEIRTSGNKIDLPNSGLFGTNPDSSADYLIETDPAFANYKNWLSSGYMLDRLKLDPSVTQKRLGDGYYEQQYIRDQIMMLTGRYYLGNYGDQDTQYKSLMDAGITAAQTLNLRPGIALTDNQVAKLTTDIVWLVAQNITLADGSSQSVLVPKVYTRQAASQIDGTGNLIAANNIDMSLSGDLDNQGNIVGHKQVKINANSLTNQNGGVIAGDYVQIGTQNDLNNLGGTLAANSAMQLNVGGDLNNQSITYNTQAVKGASNGSRTGIAQIASIYIGDGLKGQVDADGNPLTTFVANMGGNTTFTAGRLDNLGGSSLIDTKGNVALNAVNTSYQTNSIEDANNYFKQGESTDVGSQLRGNSDIIIKAGNNVTGTATQINSNSGTVGIKAGNDITFTEGRNTQNLSTATKTTSKDFLSKETTQDRFDSQSDNAITSNIEGNKVAMQAGNDISFTGTNAISDTGTTLSADGDIDILSAKNTSSQSTFSQTKKSGLFGSDGGIGFTIGKQQTDDSNTKTALTHTASNIGAIDGNVIINAGGTYQQTGSNLIAGMGADTDKDINADANDPNRGNTVVRAQDINIDNALDIYKNQSESKFKQTGLTVSVSNSLIDSARAIDDLAEAAGNTESVRMKGMASAAGLLKVKALAKQAASATKGLAGGINADSLKGMGNTRIQATIGSQKSQSNSSSYTEVNQGSNINTNNLALIATGAGTDSNININGSSLNVTNDALFQADNDFNVSGVAQESNTRSDNSSSSAAIGGYASTGSGVGITASASKGKGYANSDSVTYANSNINVGSTTTFDIGNDVNIKGGVINTDRAQGVIGGDVNIESLQDTATYDSNQKNAGFTLDVDLKGAGSSLSVNGGKTDVNADYKAVGEQSGIFTEDGGFDLTVDGKTTLIGGAITTTDKALDLGLNKYESRGGITTQDIENTTSYEGDAIQVGVSLGNTTGKPQAQMNGLGYGTDSDSDSSITKAGITGVAGNSGITTDNQAEYAGILVNEFDEQRVNEELGAQVEITQAFDQERRKIKTELNQKEQGLRAEAEEAFNNGNFDLAEEKALAAGKLETQGLLFDAISGAIYGPNSNGAVGYATKAASPFVANQIGQYYKELAEEQGGNLTGTQQAGHILAHGILGAATSSATGNDALTGGLSAGTGEAAAPLISDFLYGTSDPSKLTAEQKDTISSITSALGAGIGLTTGNASDVANAAETSKVAVEDNNLKNKDVKELLRQIDVAKAKYKGGELDTKMREIRALAAKMSEDNYKEIKACEKNPTEACLNRIKVDYGNVNFKELGDDPCRQIRITKLGRS
ncbi:hemagglutinin repeat-containing protein [Psychrobacter sp. KFRI-CH2-11]|uniref:hemagglutinin repeat-containing protein n=1 Tax=Psychrobacter sp. KFRI-CH2-11 TaxID=3156079 RepID=UPI00325487E7